MLSPESRLFGRIDSVSDVDQEQQRLLTLSNLALLETESVPVFEEAAQTAAHFLDAPICVLGLIDGDRQWFKAAVGLSRIGLMNELAASRQLPRQESFCTHVVESRQALAVSDATQHPIFANSLLVRHYGIRAYLGVPLMASNGHCIGALAIMELQSRQFSNKEIEFLELTARWCMSEFERNHLLKQHQTSLLQPRPLATNPHTDTCTAQMSQSELAQSVKVSLISHMTQELRTPLTSILGMASVLGREIYGPLTDKQKEYMEIVRNSGQYLLSLVNEILELGTLNEGDRALNLSPVDVEMLCQQVLSAAGQAAQRREQQIRLTVEPGHRIWFLDKDKVRQMLYHLVFSVIQSSSADSVIRIHVSRRQQRLNLTIWTSHPWLGEGLPQAELYANQFLHSAPSTGMEAADSNWADAEFGLEALPKPPVLEKGNASPQYKRENSRQGLGVMLSRQLAEMHGGRISIQGSAAGGYRYVVSLPLITDAADSET